MTTRRIAILSDAVANRIAAGEVVERPASVVKELLENAVDAGAGAVAVEIEAGGKTLVRVADDGEGMGREDALLALDRHATSKIRSADDLVGVATFGFRGEALPSIASVSRLELETATAAEPVGTRIAAAGGAVTALEDRVRQPGTTVTVRALFFNTPARRKFLRSTRSEVRSCTEAMMTLALARPDLGLTLLADGRAVVEALPAGSLADRAAQLFGERLAATLLPVDSASERVRVTGLIQRPAEAAASGRVAYLFVNGRPFRDPFLVRAAERGYRATVPAGVRPSLILCLEVAAADVDVNVHPAKLEVRFRDRYAVEAAVEEAVHEALGPLTAAAPYAAGASMPWEHRAVGPAPGAGAPVRDLFAAGGQGDEAGTEPDAGAPAGAGEGADMPRSPSEFRVVAQLHQTYLLVEAADGLLIVDQHSAHERILYERAMRTLTEGAAGGQKLLFPLTVTLAPEELEAVESHGDLLARLGYEVEPFGGSALIVHATPAPHPRFDAERCLREVVADLAGGRFGGLHNRVERFASTFACRAAIKAGQPLTTAEMNELVQRLMAAELPAHDVHGRPTIVQLPLVELHRRFGRR
ncbi:MAG: DNA mismatch repair endonuclease MutL [Gemmatimonadales bacterium]|jgi:DNA mismatch repair protein MutL